MALPTQQFIDIREVRNGVVLLKNGTFVAILMVSALNLALKSPEEQEASLASYQQFLNTIDFHTSMTIQSRKLDIRPYLRTLEEQLFNQKEELLKIQTREYIEFIKTFSTEVNVMVKNFFITVTYNPPALDKKGGIGAIFSSSGEPPTPDAQEFERLRYQLDQRVGVVTQGISRLGMNVEMLSTEAILELFSNLYNPNDSMGEIGK